MLFDANGQIIAGRVLAISEQQARALIDGVWFLEHPDLLADAQLEPYCRHCQEMGLPAGVAVAKGETVYDTTCGHRKGWVIRGRPLHVPQLLDACGWNIRCTSCQEPVRGDNDPHQDRTFEIACRCTRRQLANPYRAVVEDAPSPAPTPRVGYTKSA